MNGRCPACQSDDLIAGYYYACVEPETGYDDSGPTYTCRACGSHGPAEDADVRADS